VDTISISPAGDGFYAAAKHRPDHETPHGCYRGVVYIGHMVVDEHGGEVEVFAPVPCRRCSDSR